MDEDENYKLVPEVRQSFERIIREYFDGVEPKEARVQLMLLWVTGVVENAHKYGWLRKDDKCACGKNVEDCHMCRLAKENPDCLSCQRRDPGMPSHNGSRCCKSGSVASGGNKEHCTCDTCY